MIPVGQYDRRIKLYSLVETVGAGGSATITYGLIATVWGRIETKPQRPISIGDKIEYMVRHRISFPYSKSYKAARKITYVFDGETRSFSVQNWINLGQRNAELTVDCDEIESVTT